VRWSSRVRSRTSDRTAKAAVFPKEDGGSVSARAEPTTDRRRLRGRNGVTVPALPNLPADVQGGQVWTGSDARESLVHQAG
jgi:hypothetical protein